WRKSMRIRARRRIRSRVVAGTGSVLPAMNPSVEVTNSWSLPDCSPGGRQRPDSNQGRPRVSAVILDQEPDYREVVVLICRRLGLQPNCVEDRTRLVEALA